MLRYVCSLDEGTERSSGFFLFELNFEEREIYHFDRTIKIIKKRFRFTEINHVVLYDEKKLPIAAYHPKNQSTVTIIISIVRHKWQE